LKIEKKLSVRDGFGEGLYELVKKQKNVMVLTADLAESTRVAKIAQDFPDQFVECGVSEQNMMGVAAGLAQEGFIPFVNSFAVFSPGRNWDQLRVSVCYSNLPVKIIGHHCGFSASGDGATHQAFEDLAITRCLPNLSIVQPSDFMQAKSCVKAVYEQKGPVYVRIGKYEIKGNDLGIMNQDLRIKKQVGFEFGKAEILVKGDKLTLISSGYFVHSCQEIAYDMGDIEMINVSTIKPLDEEVILKSAKKTGKVVVVEDHQITGGLGSAVCELLSEKLQVPVLRLGMKNEFGRSGSVEELVKFYCMDRNSLIRQIDTFIS